MKTKNDAKHTPGPWHIGGEHTSNAQEGLRGHFAIGNGSKGGIAYANKTGLIDRAEAEANARLIAAAPDLLALLAEGAQRAAEVEEAPGDCERLQDIHAWAQDARAAIAKATGQEVR